jgi:exosome complex RNA-binding protein Rrp42 (RNase PH superfamily)
MKDDILSANEITFIKEALHEHKRLDGRGLFDLRATYATFGRAY